MPNNARASKGSKTTSNRKIAIQTFQKQEALQKCTGSNDSSKPSDKKPNKVSKNERKALETESEHLLLKEKAEGAAEAGSGIDEALRLLDEVDGDGGEAKGSRKASKALRMAEYAARGKESTKAIILVRGRKCEWFLGG